MTLLTIFFDLVLLIINTLLSFIPVLAIPIRVMSIFAWFFELISPGAYFVDMLSFFQCAMLLLSVYIVKFMVYIFNFFVAHIPFLKIGVLKK